METMKIVSQNPETQGDYVLINAEDFDESKHVPFVEGQQATAQTPRKRKVTGDAATN